MIDQHLVLGACTPKIAPPRAPGPLPTLLGLPPKPLPTPPPHRAANCPSKNPASQPTPPPQEGHVFTQ